MNDKTATNEPQTEPRGPGAPPESKAAPTRRRSPSLFGPIVLITIGVVALLANLGRLPGALYWDALLRLWPLLLVFLGLNLIVRQAPRPWGSFLSALVGVTAVTMAGYVLLFADQIPLLQESTPLSTEQLQRDVPVSYALDGIESAEMRIDLGPLPAELTVLEDSQYLIDGTVTYAGDLIFDVDQSGTMADLRLDTRSPDFWFLNPGSWRDFDDDDRWEIGLSPVPDLDLRLDGGSGSYDADLARLTVRNLSLDGGSGSGEMTMPSGNYDAFVDVGSGSIFVRLPGDGAQQVEIDGGSGGLRLLLPDTMAARFEIDYGSGSFSAGDRLLQQSGDDDFAIWETPNYDQADNRILVEIDGGSGSIAVETAEQGR